MAENLMLFKGLKQVLDTQIKNAEGKLVMEKGFVYFVRTKFDDGTYDGDIYFNNKHYGHFGDEAKMFERLESLIGEIPSGTTVADALEALSNKIGELPENTEATNVVEYIKEMAVKVAQAAKDDIEAVDAKVDELDARVEAVESASTLNAEEIAEINKKLHSFVDLVVKSGRVETDEDGETVIILTLTDDSEVKFNAKGLIGTYAGSEFIDVKDYVISLKAEEFIASLNLDEYAKVVDVEKAFEDVDDALSAIESAMTETNDAIEAVDKKVDDAVAVAEALEKRVEDVEGEVKTAQDDIDAVKEDVEGVKEDIAAIEEEIVSIESAMTEATEAIIALDEKIDNVQKDLEDKLAEVEDKSHLIFDTYADALAFANDAEAVPGMVLSVPNDPVAKNNGVYSIVSVESAEDADDAVIAKVCAGNEPAVFTKYSDAMEAVTIDNVGQIIYLAEDEDIDDGASGFTAVSGPYIVVPSATAENGVDLRILDTRDVVETDVADEVASLQSQMGVLRDEIAKKADALEGGDFISVEAGEESTIVSVKVSEDEGNLLKAGTDGGMFAGLYYECADDEDLDETVINPEIH